MKIDILTLFPEMFTGFLNESIIKRAIDKKKVEVNLINFRDYTPDPHNKVDDTPFGGGAGMVLMIEPIYNALMDIKTDDSHIVLLTPSGVTYNESKAKELKKYSHLILICGHYEGFDERIRQIIKPREVSIGDFVLTGGELPALCVMDSVSRKLEGTLGKIESAHDDSFSDGLLEYPQYTKPREYRGLEVPEVLLNGNHKLINEFRFQQKIERTKTKRPDLYKKWLDKQN